MSKWRYQIDGVKHGPVSSSELRELASRGVISAETLVTKEGLGGWVRARKVVGLISPMPAPVETPRTSMPERPAPTAADDDDDLDFGEDPALANVRAGTAVVSSARARRGVRVWVMVACSAFVLTALGAAVAYVALRPSDAAADRAEAQRSSVPDQATAPALKQDPATVPSTESASAAKTDSPISDAPAVPVDASDAREPQPVAGPPATNVRLAKSGDFTVTVSNWGYQEFAGRVTDILTATRASGQFLWFALKVTNEGNSAARILPNAITLRDGKGRTFEPSDEGMAAIAADHAMTPLLSAGNVPWMQSFPPGVQVGVQVIFDVPVQRSEAGGTKEDPGQELVLDLGGREATISVAAMRAAAVAARDAFNAKFDRLMAAYDDASAVGPAVKSFDVTFARARWVVPAGPQSPFPQAIRQQSCLAYYPGRVGVAANGIVLEPGWRVPPAAPRPDAARAPADPAERFKEFLKLRTAVREARGGVQGTWLAPAGESAGESAGEGKGAGVSVSDSDGEGEGKRQQAREPTPEESASAHALSEVRSHSSLIGSLPGMNKCAERLADEQRRGTINSFILVQWKVNFTNDQRWSRELNASSYAASFRDALNELDSAAVIVEDLARISPGVEQATIEAGRDATAAEAAARAAKTFLPFPQGWFLALPAGTLFKGNEDRGTLRPPGSTLEVPIGPQFAGIGTLDGPSVAWIAAAAVEGVADVSPPRAVDAESCLAAIDPLGFPVLMMFASPAERNSFEVALRSAAADWGKKWGETAKEYATLEIGESMQTGARALELGEQGRSINLMSRRQWLIPDPG